MNKPLRQTVIGFLALTMAAILVGGCAILKVGKAPKENAEHPAEKPKSAEPSHPFSRLLPTLEVAGDSCYVFLQPKGQAPYFGPLVKGEKIRWLDFHGSWIRVWIPRLRISGWVRRTRVHETSEPPSSTESVPENLLSSVIVITKWANVREAPTTNSRILLVAKKNQEFWLLNEKGGWYQIWVPDLKKEGWISRRIVAKRQKN